MNGRKSRSIRLAGWDQGYFTRFLETGPLAQRPRIELRFGRVDRFGKLGGAIPGLGFIRLNNKSLGEIVSLSSSIPGLG